jgi:hypothetical protein
MGCPCDSLVKTRVGPRAILQSAIHQPPRDSPRPPGEFVSTSRNGRSRVSQLVTSGPAQYDHPDERCQTYDLPDPPSATPYRPAAHEQRMSRGCRVPPASAEEALRRRFGYYTLQGECNDRGHSEAKDHHMKTTPPTWPWGAAIVIGRRRFHGGLHRPTRPILHQRAGSGPVFEGSLGCRETTR